MRVGEGTLIDLFPRRLWNREQPHNPNHLCFALSGRDFERLRQTLAAEGIAVTRTEPRQFGARGYASALYFAGPEGVQLEARTYGRAALTRHL